MPVDTKQHAQELVEQLDASQLAAAVRLLEVMVPHDEDDEDTLPRQRGDYRDRPCLDRKDAYR